MSREKDNHHSTAFKSFLRHLFVPIAYRTIKVCYAVLKIVIQSAINDFCSQEKSHLLRLGLCILTRQLADLGDVSLSRDPATSRTSSSPTGKSWQVNTNTITPGWKAF